MAIELATSRPAAPARGRADSEQAQVWLNVGVDFTDPETGEVTFIGLPLGIPLDTMKPKTFTGSSEDWHKLLQAKNDLLVNLQKISEGLASGEDGIIGALKVQMRRVAKAEAPAAGTNPMLSALADMSIVKTAAKQVA